VLQDNSAAMSLAHRGPARKSRHFDIAFNKMKDVIEFGEMELKSAHTDDNYADFFRKGLGY